MLSPPVIFYDSRVFNFFFNLKTKHKHKSMFATCIRRMLRLACSKLRKIHGFSTRHVENSFRRVVTQPWLHLVGRKLRQIHKFSTCHVKNSFRRVVSQPCPSLSITFLLLSMIQPYCIFTDLFTFYSYID